MSFRQVPDILFPRTFQLNLTPTHLISYGVRVRKKKKHIFITKDMEKLNWVAGKCTEFIEMIGERRKKSVIYMLEKLHCTRKAQSSCGGCSRRVHKIVNLPVK